MNRHYFYWVGFAATPPTANAILMGLQLERTAPVSTSEDIAAVREGVISWLAPRHPSWGRSWRDTVIVLSVSLLRVEVEQRGRRILADWQPWGPLNPQ